jgi:hypothetical protein
LLIILWHLHTPLHKERVRFFRRNVSRVGDLPTGLTGVLKELLTHPEVRLSLPMKTRTREGHPNCAPRLE